MPYYGRHDEDLARFATSVTASSEDAEYPAENLISENAARPAKLTTTSGDWVLGFASAVTPVAAVMAYQYLDEGLEVRLQGNATDSWGAPSFNQAFTIPAKRLDGPSYQRWTVNPVLVLVDPAAFAFWRLVIVGTNSQVVAVGRLLLLSAWREIDLFEDPDIPEADDPTYIEDRTVLGVENFYVLGGPRRSVSAVVIGTDLSAGTAPIQEAADFRALHESSEGRAHPFVLLPFGANDAWLARFESASGRRVHHLGGHQKWDFAVREVSRGLPWP
jgi:hypothetical protein